MHIHSLTNATFRPLHSTQSSVANNIGTKKDFQTTLDSTGDKVTLSSDAQKISAVTNPGVEQYSLPSWFTEFSPSFANLSKDVDARHEETVKYTAFHEQLAAGGLISWKDAQALKSYVNTMMPANTERKQIEADYIQNQALYKEYGQIHEQYFQEALSDQGIITQADWDAKVKNAPDENQGLRLSVMGKMFSNPRAMELMNVLRIQKPAV